MRYATELSRYVVQVISDHFETHQAKAGRPIVMNREAQQAWDNGFLPRRNTKGAADTRLLIGETDGGRKVTFVSRDLGDGVWFTYTAWDTKDSDLA